MNISVTYKLFDEHPHIIKNLAIQNQSPSFVFSSGIQSDQLRMYTFKDDQPNDENLPNIQFEHINISPYKQTTTIMEWSQNDKYLAVACDKLTIYEYKDKQLNRFKEYTDHQLEITSISWSADSERIASGGLDGLIVIRNIKQGEKIKEISESLQIMGIIWDKFDKYLTVLCSDNRLKVWKTNDWEKVQELDLNFPESNKNTSRIIAKRQDRKIDQSPDYKYILVPSLDDKVVPIVCAIDRQKQFKIIQCFMGPFSSINCVKFNKNLYQLKDKVINVFAMGDNDGNISVWGIGEEFTQDKPFFLLRSHKNGQELIEDIVWSADGSLMMATTMKKYVLIVYFTDNIFGTKLNDQQRDDFIMGQYGGLKTISSAQQFQVYRPKNQFLEEEEPNMQQTQTHQMEEEKINHTEKNDESKEQIQKEVIMTEQQNIIKKDGKKMIVPMKRIEITRKTNDKDNENKQNIQVGQTYENSQQKLDIQRQKKKKSQILNEVSQKLKNPVPLPDQYIQPIQQLNIILEFSTFKNQQELYFTKVECSTPQLDPLGQQKSLWCQVLQGRVNILEIVKENFFIVTTDNLFYQIDQQGCKSDIPFHVGKICYLKVNSLLKIKLLQGNNKNNILAIDENAFMYIFDLKNMTLSIKENIQNLIKAIKQEISVKDPIEKVQFDDNNTPIIYSKNDKIYMFDCQSKCFNQMDYNQFFELGLIRATDRIFQEKNIQVEKTDGINNFFEKLAMDEKLVADTVQSDIKGAAKIEEYLIFTMKYQPEKTEKFIEFYQKYVKLLCDLQDFPKLRILFYNTFYDDQKREFKYIQSSQLNKNDLGRAINKILMFYPHTSELQNELQEFISF